MKIRLQITASPSTSFAFEHGGPSLYIGRDPDGELALDGEASQSVSWNHARIELTPSGAFVADLNSTNGTLLNDKRVVSRTEFKLGDQIQLGYTGPTLKVVDLELLAAPARSASLPPEVPAGLGQAGGAQVRRDLLAGHGNERISEPYARADEGVELGRRWWEKYLARAIILLGASAFIMLVIGLFFARR